MMTNRYAKVVIPGLALDTAFDYILDEEQQKQIIPGRRVTVPFGTREVEGVVVDITDTTTIKNLKKIIGVESGLQPIPADLRRLTRKVADYYYASWGEALQACLIQKRVGKKNSRQLLQKCETMSLPGLLTENQIRIRDSLISWLRQKDTQPLLLRGNSLETRISIYIEVISASLPDSQVLILFPGIDLLVRYAPLFKQRYGECVGIVHSDLTPAQLSAVWEEIRTNQKRIILGTRMALFYDFPQLSLIIVEQEHEPAYKSDQKPMYHGRDVAIMRHELFQTPVLLASDTASVESYGNWQQKKYTLLLLEDNTEKSHTSFQLIQMTEHDAKKEHYFLTSALLGAIKERLQRKEKVLIFANMKGFSGLVMCRMCGKVRRCPHCGLALSWSKETNRLSCRYCNFKTKFKEECPECDSHHYKTLALGVEAAAEKIKNNFPEARVGILDSKRFSAGFDVSQFDIIVGTQILNKIPTYPRATLLGVLLIDVLLNLPDFRSGERVFQNVFALAKKLDCSLNKTQVLIQSYNCDHYVIKALLENNPDIFYAQDLALREELNYPPFGAMVQILFKGKDKAQVVELAQQLSASCNEEKVTVLGPAPAYREKMRGEYRQQLLFSSKDREGLIKLLHSKLDNQKKRASAIKIIVDPVELL